MAEKRRRLGGERRAAVERGDRQLTLEVESPAAPVGRHVGATRDVVPVTTVIAYLLAPASLAEGGLFQRRR